MTGRPYRPSADVAELASRAAVLTAAFRTATIAEALECSPLMVWKWTTGVKVPSLAPGRAGRRFFDLLRALDGVERGRAAERLELRVLDREGDPARWDRYDRLLRRAWYAAAEREVS